MKLDFLFNRHRSPGSPHTQGTGPNAEIFDHLARPAAECESPDGPWLALPPPHLDFSVRKMSPRQLAEWAHEMYLSGALNWPEYRFAGFHAELHSDYNSTVGALTGRPAAPDGPRDMIREWEERLAFFHRHNPPHDPQVKRIEKILALLYEPGKDLPKQEGRTGRAFVPRIR
jgi:hypothetical protein